MISNKRAATEGRPYNTPDERQECEQAANQL
jgi:hypothetical protein